MSVAALSRADKSRLDGELYAFRVDASCGTTLFFRRRAIEHASSLPVTAECAQQPESAEVV